MLSSQQNEAQADPAKVQARKMLRMLYKFMLPIIQSASEQRIDPKKVVFGIEADEFVTELENFISGIISRSKPDKQDITIEAMLEKEEYSQSEEDEGVILASSNNRGPRENPGHISPNRTMSPHRSVPLDVTGKVLGENLQVLRKHVTQKMPIRLLFFEPHDSKLKISLLERADIYNYLALKFRAEFRRGRIDYANPWISEHGGYAILSHTWNQVPGELTYEDWKKGSVDATQPKYRKLVNFCKAAWENHNLTLGWIDTVCINKESSAELDESIRSMYAWYSNAKVCITYLATTNILSDMHNDPWFTRGWTLQELLAPRQIKFYNMHWIRLCVDSKNDINNSSIREEIESATTIIPAELYYIHGAPISRRMQLAAKRQVTRGEDIAYCLMGIFDVSISTAYGEGAERAFFRLVEEIFRSTKNVSDIFNWAGERDFFSRRPISSLFPAHPSNYLNRSTNEQLSQWRPIEPLTLTHLGLRTPMLLMPAIPLLRRAVLPYPPPVGDYYAAVSIAAYRPDAWGYVPDDLPGNYLLLDERISGPEAVQKVSIRLQVVKITLTFGTLNVEERGTSICIPKACLAVLLAQQVNAPSPVYEKAYTENPIVFDLKKIRNNSDDEDKDYYLIKRSKLENHGMRLVTLFL